MIFFITSTSYRVPSFSRKAIRQRFLPWTKLIGAAALSFCGRLCLISPRVRVRVCVRIRVGNPNICVENPEPEDLVHVTNGQTVEKEIHHDGRILSHTGSLSPLQGFCHVLLCVGDRWVKSLCFSIYVREVLRFCARRKSISTSFLYQRIFVFKNDGHNSDRL